MRRLKRRRSHKSSNMVSMPKEASILAKQVNHSSPRLMTLMKVMKVMKVMKATKVMKVPEATKVTEVLITNTIMVLKMAKMRIAIAKRRKIAKTLKK